MKSFICSSLRWRRWLKPLLAATLVLGTGCVGDGSSIDEQDAEMNADLTLGAAPVTILQGVNSVTGAGLNTVLTGHPKSTGAQSTYDVQVATSSGTLASSLSIDGSISAEFALVGSVSGKASFAKSLNTSRYTTTVVVHAVHSNGWKVDDATLMSGKAAWIKANPGQFVKSYGDSYVSGIEEGGELIGVYVFSSQTSEEQKQLAVDINAGLNLGFIKASVDFNSQMNKIAYSAGTSWSFYSYVSGTKNPPAISPDNIIESARSFSQKTVFNAPVVTGITVTSYDAVKYVDLSAIGSNRDYINGTNANSPGPMLFAMQKISAQIDDLSAIYSFYKWHGDDDNIADAKIQLYTDMDTLSQQMSSYLSDPAAKLTHYTPSNFKSLMKGFPSLNVSAHHAGAWGGSSGQDFLDYPAGVNGYVKRMTRIRGIGLTFAGGVGGVPSELDMLYADANHRLGIGHWNQAQQKSVLWYVHGKGGGDKSPAFFLDDGAFLGWVAVWANNNAVARLNFCAQTYCYNGGGESGEYHGFPVPADSVIMGFEGNAAAHLNSLRIDYFTFHPATWQSAI